MVVQQLIQQGLLLQQITNPLNGSLDLQAIFNTIVEQVHTFLQVDRVKLYRFEADCSGTVIAESVQLDRLPSLLGLHFPASDIPPRARELFINARQRVIVDVASKRKVLNSTGIDGNDDIRYAPVDPCHIQYLLSMGVLSSLSVPIFHQQQFWGLLAIHHSESRHFSEHELQTVQLWASQVSVALSQIALIAKAQQQAQREALVHYISQFFGAAQDPAELWPMILQESVAALKADGGRLYITADATGSPAQVYTCGLQPQGDRLEEAPAWQQFIQAASPKTQLSEGELQACVLQNQTECDAAPATESQAAPHIILQAIADLQLPALTAAFADSAIQSMMVVPLQSQDQVVGYLTCFRQAQTIEISWAGQQPPDPRRQRPRESFAAWLETRQEVPDWNPEEIRLAQQLGLQLYMAIVQQWVKQMVEHQASHDVLTQLPNWLLFKKQLSLTLIRTLQQGEVVAVGILDLDRFKGVNETLGHAVGDYLLQQVTSRLQEGLKHCGGAKTRLSFLSRWHGDGFALLLPQANGIAEANQASHQLLEIFKTPFYVQGQEVYLSASLGVALAPYDGESVEILIQHAEVAMHQAKSCGKNQYQIYSPSMSAGSFTRLFLEADLHRALERDEFLLYYQPQVDLATGYVVGLEALIRWQHPRLGLVAPDQFIPLAEETGLIRPIGEWVLRTACQQHHVWQLAGIPPIQIAVNLSAQQFQQPDLSTTIAQILQVAEMEAGYLELEITENTAIQDYNQTLATLRQLSQAGIRIAIDDFGMGYSSLNTLRQLPIHTLKVDKSFIRDALSDASGAAIVKAITALGKGLNLPVIAEGVETKEQLEFLRAIQCERIQGYLISRPLASDAMTHWLLERPIASPKYRQPCPSPYRIHYQPISHAAALPSGTETTATEETATQTIATAPVVEERRELTKKILEYEQLKQELKQQTQHEHLVAEIAQRIRQSLDLQEILSTTVNEIRQFFQTDRVILYRFRPDWSGDVVQESVATDCLSIMGFTIDDPCFRENYVKYYRQGRVRAIADVQSAGLGDCHKALLTNYEVKANLVVPVMYRDQLWGLLIAHHCRETRQWRQYEISLMSQLATQAAIAINQGELYQQLESANRELQELSGCDGLTKIANRYRFDSYLNQEWRRLKRQQTPLALILCDIDDFKLYNDTYGHQAGDRCLQQVAQAIRASVQRPADLVARYGVEEFAIILPETSLEAAYQVAEKVRLQVRALGIPHAHAIYQCITLSLGVASFIPSNERSEAGLIAVADEALYRAKAIGRDRTICMNTYLP
ncbi:MAG: diguanylate cyclase [Trichocoleus desertorum ATA4-8-CV12]|jgi:diguanylate cyclase (GGDEF)-like protein|nr:diguanylate cyclase [Trichocoleus desertorum ATA4-8-CV12]